MRGVANTAYATAIHRLTDQELFQAARDVNDTLNSPGWRLLMELTASRRAGELRKLIDGHLDHAQYQAVSGFIRGLDAMRDAGEAVIEKADAKEAELSRLAEEALS